MKKVCVWLMVVCLMLSLSLTVAAEEEPILTLDRVIQISDTELVFEFSEPIVINKWDPDSNGPFVGLRVVNKKGAIQSIGEDATHVYLQWKGALSYVDSAHDRLLWTMTGQALGFTTIQDIFSWRGQLADFQEKCDIRLVIEEIPLNKAVSDRDGGVFNITTTDGSRNLFATHITGWESTQLPVEVNYRYEIDRSAMESTRLAMYEGTVLYNGADYQPADTQIIEPDVITVTAVRNDPMVIAFILGGALLLGVGIMLITGMIRKRKAAK